MNRLRQPLHLCTQLTKFQSVTYKIHLPPVQGFILTKNARTISSLNNVVIPEPPVLPVTEQVLNALGEPTFSSLGLNSYWPSGWYQASLEALHVSFGLPWWGAIAASTIIIRLFIFPFLIHQRRQLGKYIVVMPKLNALQQRLTDARLTSNQIEAMRVSVEIQNFLKNNDVNPLKTMIPLFIQVPIFLSVFTGLRAMTALPVKSLETGGFAWFVDFTASDPYCLLPLLSMGSILAMVELSKDLSSNSAVFKYMMRGFSVVGFFFVMNMPSALLWYWTVSNFVSVGQSLLLRNPKIRNRLGFPEMPTQPVVEKKKQGFIQGFKENFTNSRLLAELEARQRLDEKDWQNSGRKQTPITFRHDPTKPKTIKTVGEFVESYSADKAIRGNSK